MRLRSDIWVSGYLRRCHVKAVPVFVARRGQAEAGAIYVSVDRLDGTALLLGPAPAGLDGSDTSRRWVALFDGAFVSRADVTAYLSRQASFDPDFWHIEVEDHAGRHFLDGELVDA